jgi:hypothetical protein
MSIKKFDEFLNEGKKTFEITYIGDNQPTADQIVDAIQGEEDFVEIKKTTKKGKKEITFKVAYTGDSVPGVKEIEEFLVDNDIDEGGLVKVRLM